MALINPFILGLFLRTVSNDTNSGRINSVKCTLSLPLSKHLVVEEEEGTTNLYTNWSYGLLYGFVSYLSNWGTECTQKKKNFPQITTQFSSLITLKVQFCVNKKFAVSILKY